MEHPRSSVHNILFSVKQSQLETHGIKQMTSDFSAPHLRSLYQGHMGTSTSSQGSNFSARNHSIKSRLLKSNVSNHPIGTFQPMEEDATVHYSYKSSIQSSPRETIVEGGDVYYGGGPDDSRSSSEAIERSSRASSSHHASAMCSNKENYQSKLPISYRVKRRDSGMFISRSNSLSPTNNIGCDDEEHKITQYASQQHESEMDSTVHETQISFENIVGSSLPKHLKLLSSAYKLYCNYHANADQYFFASIKQSITHLLTMYNILNQQNQSNSFQEARYECDGQIRSLTEHLVLASQKHPKPTNIYGHYSATQISKLSQRKESCVNSQPIVKPSSYPQSIEYNTRSQSNWRSTKINHRPSQSSIREPKYTSLSYLYKSPLVDSSESNLRYSSYSRPHYSHVNTPFIDPNNYISNDQCKPTNLVPKTPQSQYNFTLESARCPNKLNTSRSATFTTLHYPEDEFEQKYDLRQRNRSHDPLYTPVYNNLQRRYYPNVSRVAHIQS